MKVTIITRNGRERNGIFREEFKALFYGTERNAKFQYYNPTGLEDTWTFLDT